MNISQMIEQLIGGMGVSIQIFVVTLVFSLPLGLMVSFGRMSKNPIVRNLNKGVHIHYEGHPFDAPADGSLFWSLFSVWH